MRVQQTRHITYPGLIQVVCLAVTVWLCRIIAWDFDLAVLVRGLIGSRIYLAAEVWRSQGPD